MPTTTWILIANASLARLYETHKARLFQANGSDDGCLRLIQTFDHAESRLKTSDLVSDRMGDYHNRRGYGAGSYSEATDPKEHEAEIFARELVEELETRRAEGKIKDLIIIATPHFQGVIQYYLKRKENLSKIISSTIEKDYTQLKGRELIHTLQNQL